MKRKLLAIPRGFPGSSLLAASVKTVLYVKPLLRENRPLNPPPGVYITSSPPAFTIVNPNFTHVALYSHIALESRFNAARRQFVIYEISEQELAISLLMNSHGITIASQFLQSAFVTVVTFGWIFIFRTLQFSPRDRSKIRALTLCVQFFQKNTPDKARIIRIFFT